MALSRDGLLLGKIESARLSDYIGGASRRIPFRMRELEVVSAK